jgi:hypothetical protein
MCTQLTTQLFFLVFIIYHCWSQNEWQVGGAEGLPFLAHFNQY